MKKLELSESTIEAIAKQILDATITAAHKTAYYNQQDRIDTEKAIAFVEHIENHLKSTDKVICTICGKTIDEIYEESDHEV